MSTEVQYEMKCYDPRRGQDFSFRLGGRGVFSSLKQKVLVVTVSPRVSFWKSYAKDSPTAYHESYSAFLRTAIENTSANGFFSLDSLTKAVTRAAIPEIGNATRVCGSVLGYFEPTGSQVDRILALRDSHQSYEEWIIGGCSEHFDLPVEQETWYRAPIVCNLEFFLGNPDTLGCLFYRSGEAREDIIVTQLWDGIDELIRGMAKHL